MAKNVVFDEASAARIAAAVKWVEQFSLDETQDPDEPLPPDADKPETVCRELSHVEASGNLTLITGVACVNGNLTVTTSTITLSDLATVTTQNLTLPKQEGCN